MSMSDDGINHLHVRQRSMYRTVGEKAHYLEAFCMEHTHSGRFLSFAKHMIDSSYVMLEPLEGDPVRDFRLHLEKFEKNGWRECAQSSYSVDLDDQEDIIALHAELKGQLQIDSEDEIERLMRLVEKLAVRREAQPAEDHAQPYRIATTHELLGSW